MSTKTQRAKERGTGCVTGGAVREPRVLAVSSWAGSSLSGGDGSTAGEVSPVLAVLNVAVLLRTMVLSWALRSAESLMV